MAINWTVVFESTSVLALLLSLIVVSYRYALPVFISELEATNRPIRLAFSLTSGTSFLVFFLIWAEFGQWISSIRAIAWHTSIIALLTLLIVVLPLTLNFTYFSDGAGLKNRFRIPFALVTYGLQIYLFVMLGKVIPQDETTSQSFLTACVLRIGFLGVTAMALVSGFGAISSLWNLSSKRRLVSEFEISRLRQSMEIAQEQLEAKARLIRKLEIRTVESDGLFARLLGAESSADMVTAEADYSDLSDLHNSLLADLIAAQAIFEDQKREKTKIGMLYKTFDVLFSIYCLYRICTTTWSLTPWKSDASDPVSQLLALLVAHYDENIDQESWARSFGFMLSGIVIMGSLRACLLVLARMSKVLPRLINQQSMALVFALLIGLYNMATAIVLCRNLPSEFGKNIRHNLGTSLDQSRFDIWFDSVFLVSCVMTTLILFVQYRVCGVDADDLRSETEKRV